MIRAQLVQPPSEGELFSKGSCGSAYVLPSILRRVEQIPGEQLHVAEHGAMRNTETESAGQQYARCEMRRGQKMIALWSVMTKSSPAELMNDNVL